MIDRLHRVVKCYICYLWFFQFLLFNEDGYVEIQCISLQLYDRIT